MAPAVPIALLGVVQLTAVAAWIGLAGAAVFPRLRRRVTPVFVVGALALAGADAWTALQFGPSGSNSIQWLRVAGLALVAAGALGRAPQSPALVVAAQAPVAGVVAPLGGSVGPAAVGAVLAGVTAVASWWRGLREPADRWLGSALGVGFAFTGVATALTASARTHPAAALALLSARGAATVAIGLGLVRLARTMLLGKLVGAILVGVVAMAAAAVGVVGTGVASSVQSQQSQLLLSVAQTQQQSLQALTTRAALYAQVVAQCPAKQVECVEFLTLFSEQPDYFALLVQPGHGAKVVAPAHSPLTNTALLQVAGSSIVQGALQAGASSQTVSGGPLLLSGSVPRLGIVAAVPGRPAGVTDVQTKPTYAAVYGVEITDAYLRSLRAQTGYDVSVVANGRVLASSLATRTAAQVLAEDRSARVDALDPGVSRVVAAEGNAPTAAFVAVTEAGNDDVRIATLALSQPATEALSAQRSVLQRMFVTTLIALLIVALLAVGLAQRIADPIRRLTTVAGRVRRGDLEATTRVDSRDEVGSLARAFDAMTTSLRRVNTELRDTAAHLETVVQSMSDGLVVTDESGRVTTANPTALALLGRSLDDVVGRPVAEVLVVSDAEGRSLLDAPTRRQTVDGKLAWAGGQPIPVRVGVADLDAGQGRVYVVADRRREDEVERMKTEFLANVSHELRTPLTPIRGYAEMLVRRPGLTRAQVESFVEEILNSTDRMSRAVELLVDVAALEGGRVAPERIDVSARSLVESRIAAWKERYPERAGDFRRRVAARLPKVDVDPRWVGRALDELADNAVKYTPTGTPIVLSASMTDDGRHVRMAVRDSGPGFDPSRAAELIGDFSQADASDTRRIGGMGLGLGFVSRVAQQFGLTLTVDAELGRGCDFALLLPVAGE